MAENIHARTTGIMPDHRMKRLAAAVLLFGLALWAVAHSPLPTARGIGLDAGDLSLLALICMSFAVAVMALRLARLSGQEARSRAAVAQTSKALDLVREVLDEHTLVAVTDPDGNLLEVNDNYPRRLEYPADDLIGKPVRLFYAPDQPEGSFEAVHAALKRGETWKGIQRLQTRSGRLLTTEATIFPEFDAAGRHIRSISVRTDITGRAAQIVRRSRDEIADMLNDCIFVLGPDGHFIYINRYARDRFAVKAPDGGACTRDCRQCATATDTGHGTQAERRCSTELLFGAGFAAHLARRVAHLDDLPGKGTRFEVDLPQGAFEVELHLEENVDGAKSVVMFLHGIAARRAAEREKLSHVAMISHELRTPLTSIKGALNMLESGAMGRLDSAQANLVGIASRNSERLLTLVNDILDFEKLDAGMMSFEIAPVSLPRLLEDAVSVNQGFAEAHQTRFDLLPVPEEARVQVDSGRLLQVLTNLMSNAAKYSPEGVPVTLGVEDAGAMWRITVQDRGPGIPTEARARIFDCFARAEKERDGKPRQGTGLGLAISKRIVERLGGEIGFDTSIATGHGTRFHVSLPKAGAGTISPDAE